jgi:hypothetical protein
VAEDVTSRFLNVIQLFSGSIPILAIQVSCIRVGEMTTVNFIRLVDSTKLRIDDRLTATAKATDRNYWLTRVGQTVLGLADDCLTMINEAAKRKRSLNYNKGFIGLTDGAQSNNFVLFLPRKSFLRFRAALNPVEPWTKRLQQSGLDFKPREDDLLVNVTPQALTENKELLRDLLQAAVRQDEG